MLTRIMLRPHSKRLAVNVKSTIVAVASSISSTHHPQIKLDCDIGHIQQRLDQINKLAAPVRSPNSSVGSRLKPLRTEHILQPFERALPIAYDGPHLKEGDAIISDNFVTDMIAYFKRTHTASGVSPFPIRYIIQILLASFEQHYAQPSLIRLPLAPAADRRVISVCGDTHGQFYDLLNIFSDKVGGYPSKENPFIFNGDFVDRGRYSLEVILTLLAMKLARPEAIYLTRGNHETVDMNERFGFTNEIHLKYSKEEEAVREAVYTLFSHVFAALPLAALIHDKIFVTHGGIGPRTCDMTLEEISAIPRHADPSYSEEGQPDPMSELLWSDPKEHTGFRISARGACYTFGQDVTEHFLIKNGLYFIVRSHEVADHGVEVKHGGRCVTVFSAPNYCDRGGNMGGIVRFHHDRPLNDPEIKIFSSVPHPYLVTKKKV